MQRKVVFDTCVYIDIFNDNKNLEQINWTKNVTFLAYPVFHELMIGASTKKEAATIHEWADINFSRKGRLISPSTSTIFSIGNICHRMKKKGKLDPVRPKHYNDIFIALLARQIGASVVTKNIKDFELIQSFIDFNCEFI